MKLEYFIDCTREEFFDVLLHAIIEDIYANTNKEIEIKDLKEGYKYKKIIGKKNDKKAKATIKHLNKLERYCLSVKSENGTTVIDYKIKKVDDTQIKVDYEETYTTIGGKVHDGFFYRQSLKSRVNKQFKNIEAYIKNK